MGFVQQSVVRVAALVLLTAPAAGWAQDQDPPPVPAPPLADRIAGLSTLWSEATYNFAFFHQVPDLDWDAAYRTAIDEVAAAETLYEYYRTLQAFIAQLEDGHTNVYPPDGLEDWPPLGVTALDDRFIVSRIADRLTEMVPVGSEIIAVAERPALDYAKTHVDPYVSASSPQERTWRRGANLLDGPAGSAVTIDIETPEGERRTVRLDRDRLADPPEIWTPARDRRAVVLDWPQDRVARVQLNTFSDDTVPAQFEALLPELMQADAIILDLRNNGGGSTGIGTAVLAHFTDRELVGSYWRTRVHEAAPYAWGRGGSETYAEFGARAVWTEPEPHDIIGGDEPGALASKPVAVLTGVRTASAAEDFLIYADPLESLTRIGAASLGSTGQPVYYDLPGGGLARICVKRDTWPDGRDIVGVGVEPHVSVIRTVEDIRAGRDPELDAALTHLANVPSP